VHHGEGSADALRLDCQEYGRAHDSRYRNPGGARAPAGTGERRGRDGETESGDDRRYERIDPDRVAGRVAPMGRTDTDEERYRDARGRAQRILSERTGRFAAAGEAQRHRAGAQHDKRQALEANREGGAGEHAGRSRCEADAIRPHACGDQQD
jgi:hypothetical protein